MTSPIDSQPPVPLMCDAILDRATVEQLFMDLTSHAAMLEVRLKQGSRDYSPPETPTPESARDQLLAGAVRAIQLVYRYDGHDWTDTLFRHPNGFRLVRCRHEA